MASPGDGDGGVRVNVYRSQQQGRSDDEGLTQS